MAWNRAGGVKLRELIHCAQFVQSHALSFFHLSAPDLLLGFDSDRRTATSSPDRRKPRVGQTRRGAAQVRQEIIEAGKERYTTLDRPRGVNAPLARRCASAFSPACRGARHRGTHHRFLQDRARPLHRRDREFRHRTNMCAGLVNQGGGLEWYDGQLKFKDAKAHGGGNILAAITPIHWRSGAARFVSEGAYFKPLGYPRYIPCRPAGALERGEQTGRR